MYLLNIDEFLAILYTECLKQAFWAKDWCQKFATGIFAHNSKTVNDTIKSQTRGQNYWPRALKWGIIHFCSLSTFGDTTKYMKIWHCQYLHICNRMAKSLIWIAKNAEIQKSAFYLFLSISPIKFEVQRRTIPYFNPIPTELLNIR